MVPVKPKVMIVDDDESILELFALMLTRSGYEVLAYQDSQRAVTDFQQDPGIADLIITDEQMPRLNGVQFAQKVFTIRPDTPMILCSGSLECDENMARDLGFRSFLPKPVYLATLVGSVENALDKKQAYH